MVYGLRFWALSSSTQEALPDVENLEMGTGGTSPSSLTRTASRGFSWLRLSVALRGITACVLE